jgi:hypothetical protein
MGQERIEQIAGQEEESEGIKYLRLLDLEYLADTPVGESQTPGRDFLDHCGPAARQRLDVLDAMDRADPIFIGIKGAMRDSVLQHLGINTRIDVQG